MSVGRRRPRGALPRSFFRRPTLEVARDLVGLVLVRPTPDGLTSGVIVETEAYVGEDDPACHASFGRTARNDPMYGDAGFAYVYLNYGVHNLLNVVTEPRDVPAAVLIRALEPRDGVAIMRRRRATASRSGAQLDEAALCRGPGNLSRAMDIRLVWNRHDLLMPGRRQSVQDGLWIEDQGLVCGEVVWTPRIGIREGTDRLWRCAAAGHPCVSGTLPRDASGPPTRRRRMPPTGC